jgi:hypothetical protein
MKKIYFLLLTFCFLNGLNAQIIDFKYSTDFKNILLNSTALSSIAKDKNGNNLKIDVNDDHEIQVNEALNVHQLSINNSKGTFGVITSDVSGIEFFTNLTKLELLSCYLSTLDVTSLKKLVELNCSYNFLTDLKIVGLSNLKKLNCQQIRVGYLNLTGLTSLEYLDGYNSWLTALDLSQCPNLVTLNLMLLNDLKELSINGLQKLESIYITSSQMTTLSVINLPSLKKLHCSANDGANYDIITKLELSGLDNLEELVCSFNRISSLDLTGMNKLKTLKCNNNRIIGNLYLSDKKKLTNLVCSNNLIDGLFVKNGYTWGDNDIYFFKNPNLKYICVEDNQYNFFEKKVYQSGFASPININSYCSFIPGAETYTVYGSTRYDADKNSCDENDPSISNFKFNIQSTNSVGNVIANKLGEYSISLLKGQYDLVPILENPLYFNCTPAFIKVNFPTQTTSFNQDFCISPSGLHQDLAIDLLPLTPARPGVETQYKIIYKNKGTVAQTGIIQFKFDNTILDYVSSNTTFSKQENNIIEWSFTDLKPFEIREIRLTLSVNRPTETPAVNNGDILKFTAIIDSQVTDEIPNDNGFSLNQIVVGSYDPNDKTCLEGSVITPSLIGEYVHYLIRFENTGTYPAQNIVVKDMIDLSKFDISTLIPTSSSHTFVTKISEGNKVEFIFENVNLPFDDANNDGYIAFKIKTLPTLVTGDSFDNEANIYFDYNFPVLTNKAKSTFKTTLDKSDFEFSNYFSAYPIPAHEVLNIAKTKEIEIQSISVYDILGQLVIALPNIKDASKIDVSNLRTGNYFLKIKSDKGSSSLKFIKN